MKNQKLKYSYCPKSRMLVRYENGIFKRFYEGVFAEKRFLQLCEESTVSIAISDFTKKRKSINIQHLKASI